MTTRRENSGSEGSSSEEEEVNEATGLLDTLLLDAETPDDARNDEHGSASDAGGLVDDLGDRISDGEGDYEETESNSRRTMELVTNVDGEQAVVYLTDVFFVPGATHGLLAIGLAAEQGFDFDYYPQVRSLRVREDGPTVIVSTPHDATWGFQVTHPICIPALGSAASVELQCMTS
ncbi:unnamed protein product [Phytophthora fragariaefolia]|uniref:Unnamed protein product n=1 Tax=Phytophthora fragariaefolia TaxID=1490495 RepID=A0A9W6TKR6_9STRA|nr:unnamed protein product [Phytophthora fragariaefolia]